MTPQELNRDIKRFYNLIETKSKDKDLDGFYNWLENDGKKEFKRLYYADDKAEYINFNNFKRMYRLNQRYRFIPLHSFYLNINY